MTVRLPFVPRLLRYSRLGSQLFQVRIAVDSCVHGDLRETAEEVVSESQVDGFCGRDYVKNVAYTSTTAASTCTVPLVLHLARPPLFRV